MCHSDSNCIEQCLNGHPEAFGLLVGRYQAVLLSYLVGRLGHYQQAEEAAQETLVRAYFALNTLKKPESFLSWLLGIATRVAKEQYRVEQRRKVMLKLKLWTQQHRQPEFSNDYALERAVAELPDPYERVVLLRYYSDMSCVQVAAKLQMPLGTVTKYLSRAYTMLRKSLRQQEGSEVQP